MAEHNNTGLHKKVSSIFDGVPVPQNNGVQQAPDASASQQHNSAVDKPDALQSQVQPKPQPQQSVQPPPTTPAAAEQPEADATLKTEKQLRLRKNWGGMKSKLLAQKPGVNATRQKTTVILVPVLVVVLIFMFIKAFNVPSAEPSSAAGVESGVESSGGVVGSGDEIDWQIPEPYPTTLRDPMRFGLAAAARGGTTELMVSGIVYSSDNPSAVVADKIVHEGDEILGVTVVKINANSVEFEMNGKKWTQKVNR